MEQPTTNVIAPKRCAECGGVMVFGELDSHMGWVLGVRYAATYAPINHTVKRYDMPDKAFPLVVNVCTICGHVSLYVAYPAVGER